MEETALDKLGWSGRRRARLARKRRAEWGPEGHPAGQVIFQLRQRARTSLRRGALFLLLLFVTVIAGLGYFVAVPLYQEWLARQTDSERARQEERLVSEAVLIGAREAALVAEIGDGLAGTWRQLSAGTVEPVRDMVFPSPRTGILLAGANEIRRTADDGISWSAVALPVAARLNALATRDGIVWAVGEGGTILRSDDGGATWSKQESGTREAFADVSFGSAADGWAIAPDSIWHTTDGGERWQPVPAAPALEAGGTYSAAESGRKYSAVESRDAANGYVLLAEENGLADPFVTEDAGSSWRKAEYSEKPPAADAFARADLINLNGIWLLGNEDVVRDVRPDLDRQFPDFLGFEPRFGAAAILDGRMAWIGYEEGFILATEDGGESWTVLETGTDDGWFAMALSPVPAGNAERQKVWAGGEDGRILLRFPPSGPLDGMGTGDVRRLLAALDHAEGQDMSSEMAGFEALDAQRAALHDRRLALSAAVFPAKSGAEQAVGAAAKLAEAATDAAERDRALALLDIALRQSQGGGDAVWRYAADRVPAGILILFLLSTLSALALLRCLLALEAMVIEPVLVGIGSVVHHRLTSVGPIDDGLDPVVVDWHHTSRVPSKIRSTTGPMF